MHIVQNDELSKTNYVYGSLPDWVLTSLNIIHELLRSFSALTLLVGSFDL